MARPRKNEVATTPWVVRDVPEKTRHQVRVYAAEHDLTMAQAIEQIVDGYLNNTQAPLDIPLMEQVIAVVSKLQEITNRRHEGEKPTYEEMLDTLGRVLDAGGVP